MAGPSAWYPLCPFGLDRDSFPMQAFIPHFFASTQSLMVALCICFARKCPENQVLSMECKKSNSLQWLHGNPQTIVAFWSLWGAERNVCVCGCFLSSALLLCFGTWQSTGVIEWKEVCSSRAPIEGHVMQNRCHCSAVLPAHANPRCLAKDPTDSQAGTVPPKQMGRSTGGPRTTCECEICWRRAAWAARNIAVSFTPNTFTNMVRSDAI